MWLLTSGFDSDIAKPEPGGVPGLFGDAWTRRWLAFWLVVQAEAGISSAWSRLRSASHSAAAYDLRAVRSRTRSLLKA